MPVTIQPATLRYKANGEYLVADSIKGDKGDKGDRGATPQFTVGSIATGEAGSDVSVTITGTAAAPVLNMSIPKGDKGNTGATPNLSIGAVETGAAGTNATATITGTPEAPVLNLSIPRGFAGPPGAGNLIAPDYYELEFPVEKGQHCIHDGWYYEANDDIATSEEWTPAHWTKISTLGDEISGVNGAIQALDEDISEVNGEITLIEGDVSDLKTQLEATKENSIFIKPSEITNPTTVSSNAASVINAAITKANTNGMHFVVVPAGEYWLTETVYLTSDVILKGCGMDATTLKIADNCDIDAIRVSAPTNNSGIMDLSIDGNRIQNYSTYVNGHHGNAINVWLHYGRIERVRTNWVYKHSLLLNYDTGNSDDGLGFEPEHQNDMGNLNKVLWCDFRDSLLQGVMWGWRTMDSWMCYTNIGSHAANLYLEGGTSRFIGNHFDGDGDNGAGPEYNVYCGDGCKAMVFENNIFENTQKENIFFRQPSYSNQTMTITIANNIIRTCSKSQNEQYANIKISGYSGSVPATEIVISGNQILNPDTNANHGYAGIHLLYCENSKVVCNTFFNVGDDEVLLDNTCENVLDDSKMSEEVSALKTQINSIEDELEMGGQPTTEYSIPSGYQDANYSNVAGTLQFKYTNSKLLLVKENGTFGEISTTNASLTIGSSLCAVIDGTKDYKFHYTYENENDANVAIIVLRCYQDNFTNNQGLWIYIPQGTGEQVVDIVALAEENEINLSSYKNVMIRAISLLEVQGTTAKNARVTISGFGVPQIPEKRLDKIEDRIDILEDEIGTFATPINVENLYEKLYEDLGYIDTSTGDLYLYNGTYIEKTSKYIPVTAGEMLHYQSWASGDPHGRIGYYDSSKNFVSYEDIPAANRESVTDGYYAHVNKTVPTGISYIRFAYYSFGNGNAYIARSGTESGWVPAQVDIGSKVYNSADDYDLKSVNHRGYNTVAPENTIPAFILSAKHGFKFVETDVNFTSDDVPVLLHDTTINRTARNADGTELSDDVDINSITYAESQDYDFGIWMGSAYAGTKIPKFEDFIILCKQLGLHPYIELKNDVQYTEAQILSVIGIVRKYGMEQNCTWISFALKPLYVVKRNAPYSRIGYIVSSITDKRITEAKFLRTQFNETFIDANITNLTSELITLTKNGGVALETYNIDTEAGMLALDSYISGVTSNIYDFNKVVQKDIMPDAVSGSTPTITGIEGHRYICGVCSTLSITAPASGCVDVVFESGSTPTVLTVDNGIKWANGFDPSSLEANTTYELNILDGELGVACSWT